MDETAAVKIEEIVGMDRYGEQDLQKIIESVRVGLADKERREAWMKRCNETGVWTGEVLGAGAGGWELTTVIHEQTGGGKPDKHIEVRISPDSKPEHGAMAYVWDSRGSDRASSMELYVWDKGGQRGLGIKFDPTGAVVQASLTEGDQIQWTASAGQDGVLKRKNELGENNSEVLVDIEKTVVALMGNNSKSYNIRHILEI